MHSYFRAFAKNYTTQQRHNKQVRLFALTLANNGVLYGYFNLRCQTWQVTQSNSYRAGNTTTLRGSLSQPQAFVRFLCKAAGVPLPYTKQLNAALTAKPSTLAPQVALCANTATRKAILG